MGTTIGEPECEALAQWLSSPTCSASLALALALIMNAIILQVVVLLCVYYQCQRRGSIYL